METKRQHIPWVSAVIVAAGFSTRMKIKGKSSSKQLLTLKGIPLLVRTLKIFSHSPFIREIVLVIRREEEAFIHRMLKKYCPAISCRITFGGNTRQESVMHGVGACSAKTEYFAIHDGARPLTTQNEINQVILLALQKGAATLGVRVKDTIQAADGEGKILFTPERSSLWAVHTPQVFEKSIYLRAAKQAELEQKEYTDDCQLVEGIGAPVWISEGRYSNLKVTTEEDITIAEALLNLYEDDGKDE